MIEVNKAVILQAVNGDVSQQEMLTAIHGLEKNWRKKSHLAALDGEWRLVWTSGTNKYQKVNNLGQNTPIKTPPQVIQRFDTTSAKLENIVDFPFGALAVGGEFEYTEKQRVQFTFRWMLLRLGNLPGMKIPLGKWAKGWLQTTYLDEELHIERGDRGGVSAYMKVNCG